MCNPLLVLQGRSFYDDAIKACEADIKDLSKLVKEATGAFAEAGTKHSTFHGLSQASRRATSASDRRQPGILTRYVVLVRVCVCVVHPDSHGSFRSLSQDRHMMGNEQPLYVARCNTIVQAPDAQSEVQTAVVVVATRRYARFFFFDGGCRTTSSTLSTYVRSPSMS